MKNISQLSTKEILSVNGGLLNNPGEIAGLIIGATIGVFLTNYRARTAAGIFSKIFVLSTSAIIGLITGNICYNYLQNKLNLSS